MNPHKIRVIEAFIRSQGGLPTDQFGKILGPDESLIWFGLNQVLSPYEQRVMKAEFALMAEAQLLAEKLGFRS